VPRLALLLPNLAGGGAERVFLDLAAAFVERDVDVDLVVCHIDGPLVSAIPDRVAVVDLGVPRALRALPALRRYLTRSRPMLLCSALTHTNAIAVAAARSTRPRVPVVVSHHNTLSQALNNAATRRDRLAGWTIRLAYPRADAIIAVSQGVADDLVRTARLDPRAITVIANPVDYARIHELAEAPAGHPWLDEKTSDVVLAIGRLHPQKDFGTLIRAFARLPLTHRLVILGEGDERESLEHLSHELGVADRVDLPGFVANPYSFMRRADVLALSSQCEGLPTVLIEALPFPIAIVATDCSSGPREILRNGDYGTLVAPGDDIGLAKAIEAVQGEPAARPREAWARYEPTAVVEDYAGLFSRVTA
jgi:glycosyltransferase involved in cell wall biosynthesis